MTRIIFFLTYVFFVSPFLYRTPPSFRKLLFQENNNELEGLDEYTANRVLGEQKYNEYLRLMKEGFSGFIDANGNYIYTKNKIIASNDSDTPENVPVPVYELAYKSQSNKKKYIDSFKNGQGGGKKSWPHHSNSPKKEDEYTFEVIRNSPYSFQDFGGYLPIKEELMQMADLLINYKKYEGYNVRVPKGILFEGPPGNGKTLLAKCFSGEINASFIPVSGSEFTERYIGVGAERVRTLFRTASQHVPCIIFIDEFDAVGRKRGDGVESSNSERDQTLNQLLIQLDGFRELHGIFLICATNRADLLDDAIKRPGRIDKMIFMGNPDRSTRAEILSIHMQGKPISKEINMASLVERTSGFSGAEIENLLNEAMLHALRDNRTFIAEKDVDEITNRVISGYQGKESQFSKEMMEKICIHELGHAMTSILSPMHPPLAKVTVNLHSPKSPAFTTFEHSDIDSTLFTREQLMSRLVVLLGGRVAEEIFFENEFTTGASHDFEEARKLAENMVARFGMGDNPFSGQNQGEIQKLLTVSYKKARVLLSTKMKSIRICSKILMRNGVLYPHEIIDIIKKNDS